MITINDIELDKLYDNPDLDKWWELEAFWILFKDCQKMWSSMLLSISRTVEAIEWEWRRPFEEYLESEQYKIEYSDDLKMVINMKIATFLMVYKTEEERGKDKKIFESLEAIEWDKDWFERSKYDWEFDYNWKYYMVVSPRRPFWSDYDEFVELISTPIKYLQRVSEVQEVKEKLKDIF